MALLVTSSAAGAHQQAGKPDRANAAFAMALAYKVVPDNINVDIPLPGRVDTSCYSSGSWSFSTITCSSYVTPPTNVQFSIPRSVVYNQIAVDGDIVTTRCVSHRVNGGCRWLEPNAYYRVALGGSRVDIETFPHGGQAEAKWVSFEVVDRRSAPLQKGTVSKDGWCFKELKDALVLYRGLQTNGVAFAKSQAQSLVDRHEVIPLIVGDSVIVGSITSDFSRIMPPNSNVPFCYFDTRSLSVTQ